MTLQEEKTVADKQVRDLTTTLQVRMEDLDKKEVCIQHCSPGGLNIKGYVYNSYFAYTQGHPEGYIYRPGCGLNFPRCG